MKMACDVTFVMMLKKNYIIWTLIGLYLLLVLYMTVIGRVTGAEMQYDIIPLRKTLTLFDVGYYGYGEYILKEILVNIALLMPIGLLLGLRTKGSKGLCNICKGLFIGFILSFTIEVLQLITMRGVFEVDDLIWNTLGCGIGWLITSVILDNKQVKIK